MSIWNMWAKNNECVLIMNSLINLVAFSKVLSEKSAIWKVDENYKHLDTVILFVGHS